MASAFDRQPMASAITVAGVCRSYGHVRALHDVDLEVPSGSIVGLVGPNGAGKSTLIRILVGALRADAGEVRVLGVDPFEERRRVRAEIGYMPQAPVLYHDLTVRENIGFFAAGRLRDGTASRIAAVLDFVDLAAAADRLVRELSGGQQQRVSLAVALVHEPKVLFLDEPTAGVDPELRHAFWTRFRGLADAGASVVVSTHQMDEVVHCDRVAILRRGGVLALSTPAELFASGGATVRVTTSAGTEPHHVASLADDLPAVLRGFGLDPSVSRIDVTGPTLEDVVLGLIGARGEGDDVA